MEIQDLTEAELELIAGGSIIWGDRSAPAGGN